MRAANEGYEAGTVLYMALELSSKTWKVALSDGAKIRKTNVDGRDRAGLLAQIERSKSAFKMSSDVGVVSCHEAGRDGHWIVRWLRSEGIDAKEIDASSIEVKQGRKHVKTDRVDVEKLLDLLMRYYAGFRRAFSTVRVPSMDDEAGQRLHRQWSQLKKDRTRYRNRMTSLLTTQGIVGVRIDGRFVERLVDLRLWDGSPLKPALIAELTRCYQLYALVVAQLKAVDEVYQSELEADTKQADQRRRLQMLKGVGPRSSRLLVMEAFGWRQFDNVKQVSGFSGLTPTPSSSGERHRESGISKASPPRIRTTMIELAWMWLRYQPDSQLSQWFTQRFESSPRSKRIGIVALARKLFVALWRYLEDGVIPQGAVFKPT